MTPPAEPLPPVAQAAVGAPPDPRVAQMESDLAETQRVVRALQQGAGQPPQTRQASPDESELNRQFYRAPVASTAAIAQQAVQDALRQHGAGYMDTIIESAKQQVRGADPDIFDKYEAEIRARVAQTDAQFHANTNVWKSAFDMVKGAHMREIVEAARPATPAAPSVHISREAGPGTPSGRQPTDPSAASKLSPEELSMAKGLGVSPDAYAAGKEHYDKQTSRGPSSWDTKITFDSETRRREARDKRRLAAK